VSLEKRSDDGGHASIVVLTTPIALAVTAPTLVGETLPP
jgi:hypothetical protein